MDPQAPPCPLCSSPSRHFHRDRQRDYYRCGTCRLVHVPPWQHLSAAGQKAHYDLHENDPGDSGYRAFLSRLFEPLVARLPPGARGLDFGSGPGPTLSLMFEEAGFPMRIYDPVYAPDDSVFECSYDFITATEVFEHLAHPGLEISRLIRALAGGGWLGVMTKRVADAEAFERWHYIRDPTHVCFFSEATFGFIAERHGLAVEFPSADTALLRRRSQQRF